MVLKIKAFLFLIIMTFPIILFAQNSVNKKIKFSGDLVQDSRIISQNYNYKSNHEIALDNPHKKSPWLATAFSLVLPGAGEFYAGSYLKAGIFVAVEAALITTAVIYNNKGNKQTTDFQNYADKNWSVVRYAQWLIDYHNADPNIITSTDASLPPWERINWPLLNQYEVGSHTLPRHGDQQYYEEIGKYDEYASGWNDFGGSSADFPPPTPNMLTYEGMRGHANDLFDVSSKAIVVIYINHFLSALDAYWSTSMFNKEVAMKMRVERQQYAYHDMLVPTLKIQVSF